jgi:hypothetical protein
MRVRHFMIFLCTAAVLSVAWPGEAHAANTASAGHNAVPFASAPHARRDSAVPTRASAAPGASFEEYRGPVPVLTIPPFAPPRQTWRLYCRGPFGSRDAKFCR